MNWQLLITIIVLLGCLAYVVYRLRKAVRKDEDNPCSHCEGCPLKDGRQCDRATSTHFNRTYD